MKFKDADLIGVPLRVVVGERGLKDGTIEIKWRNQSEAQAHPGGSRRPRRSSPSSRRRASGTMRSATSGGRPARRRGDHEHASNRFPGCPMCSWAAMTLVSFGGPFVILVVVRGGSSAQVAARPACRVGGDRTGLRSGDRAFPRLCVDRLVVSPVPPAKEPETGEFDS